jgi:hypothetical protein
MDTIQRQLRVEFNTLKWRNAIAFIFPPGALLLLLSMNLTPSKKSGCVFYEL